MSCVPNLEAFAAAAAAQPRLRAWHWLQADEVGAVALAAYFDAVKGTEPPADDESPETWGLPEDFTRELLVAIASRLLAIAGERRVGPMRVVIEAGGCGWAGGVGPVG